MVIQPFGSKPSVLLSFGTNDGLDVFHPFAILVRQMAKVFYLGGGTHSRGMLRAVVTLDQLESLLSPDLVTHVGEDFPEACDAPITLIEVSHDEGTAKWPAGYGRIAASPADFDERLRFLPEPIPYETPKGQVQRTGSGLIHWLTRAMHSGA